MSQPPEDSAEEPATSLPKASPPTVLLVLAYFLSVLMLCTSCFCISAGSWARIESEGELRVMQIHDLILAVFLYLTWRVLAFAFDLKQTWFIQVWFPLTLIGILVGYLMLLHEVQWRVRIHSARQSINRGILFKVKEAFERHATDTGASPDPNDGLDLLVNPPDNPGWKGPYLDESHLRDLWGNPSVFGFRKARSPFSRMVPTVGPTRPTTSSTPNRDLGLRRPDGCIIMVQASRTRRRS